MNRVGWVHERFLFSFRCEISFQRKVDLSGSPVEDQVHLGLGEASHLRHLTADISDGSSAIHDIKQVKPFLKSILSIRYCCMKRPHCQSSLSFVL